MADTPLADTPPSSYSQLPKAPAVRERWTRRIAPLASLIVALIITVAILPSALNLPQSNPSTVLEYAPVPPDQDNPPPPSQGGAFSSLGIADSSSLVSRAEPPPPQDEIEIPDIGAQKQCVGDRQTEDPFSPPCQAFFVGDNGGATWQGVTGDEITVLITNMTGIIIDQGQGRQQPTPSAGTYCDVDLLDCDGDGKPDDDPHMWIEVANAYSRYFNSRFQTYNRRVHLYYYWSGATTASGRRGDAADNWATLKPFAVIPQFWRGGHFDSYAQAMAQREVVVNLTLDPDDQAFFEEWKPKIWGLYPHVQIWADMYTNYICNKVAGTNVNRGDFAGQQRKYAVLSTTDEGTPHFRLFASLAKQQLQQKCGIDWGDREYTFPYTGWWVDTSSDAQTYATENMADMKAKNVNTILWLGGAETKQSHAAAELNYRPEWVLAGDLDNDGTGFASRQEQTVWDSAWAMSYQIRTGTEVENPGFRAYKEASPDGSNENWAVTFYRDYFMLWTGIQVAGPRLSPNTLDAGLHAIERRQSTNPFVPACFYLSGDYSCVKDAMEQYWDSSANNNSGCYRMVQGGKRYIFDTWGQARGVGIDAGPNYERPNQDPCSGYGGRGVGLRFGT